MEKEVGFVIHIVSLISHGIYATALGGSLDAAITGGRHKTPPVDVHSSQSLKLNTTRSTELAPPTLSDTTTTTTTTTHPPGDKVQ